MFFAFFSKGRYKRNIGFNFLRTLLMKVKNMELNLKKNVIEIIQLCKSPGENYGTHFQISFREIDKTPNAIWCNANQVHVKHSWLLSFTLVFSTFEYPQYGQE